MVPPATFLRLNVFGKLCIQPFYFRWVLKFSVCFSTKCHLLFYQHIGKGFHFLVFFSYSLKSIVYNNLWCLRLWCRTYTFSTQKQLVDWQVGSLQIVKDCLMSLEMIFIWYYEILFRLFFIFVPPEIVFSLWIVIWY